MYTGQEYPIDGLVLVRYTSSVSVACAPSTASPQGEAKCCGTILNLSSRAKPRDLLRMAQKGVARPLCVLLPRLYSLPPLHFARVFLKNHPKKGDFGLHKPEISVFMRARRGGEEEIIGQTTARGAAMFKRSRPAIYLLSSFCFSILSFCTGHIKKPPENGLFWFT